MSERRRATQLAGRNPSIRLTPLPTGNGNTLEPFPQIRSGHRINVDADILGEKTRKGLQTSAFEIVVTVFRCSNHQGKTCDEAHGRARMAVYESCHVVELGLTESFLFRLWTWLGQSLRPRSAVIASEVGREFSFAEEIAVQYGNMESRRPSLFRDRRRLYRRPR
jgi:hypothetical protein